MKTITDYEKRGLKAACKFIARKGLTVIDDDPGASAFDIVAKSDEDKVLVFAQVKTRLASDEGFPKETFLRDVAEVEVMRWLQGGLTDAEVDYRIRFDCASLLILSENRAFLRWHTNVLGAD